MLKSLKDALENLDLVTELIISKEDILKGLPPEINLFTNLKKLEITGANDGTLPFPKQLLQLPIEDLKLAHFRAFEVFELKTLKKLALWSHFTQDDILPICKNLKQLTYLEINGCNALRPLIIPPQITRLIALEELQLSCCAMQNLPDEMAQLGQLIKLSINHQSFTEFPLIITKIPNLTHLTFTHCQLVTTLPDQIQDMTALLSLNLSHNFKGKINLSFEEEMDELFDDIDNEKENIGFSIPAAFGKLINLEQLILENAHLGNINTLGNLKKLKVLNLSYGKKITNITALAELNHLEEIDLSHNSYLKDIKALGSLSNLKKLNLESAGIKNLEILKDLSSLIELNINWCSSLSSLEGLLLHPTLNNLIANEEIIGLWDRRDELKRLESVAQIKKLIASSNLNEIEIGLQKFALYVELTSLSEKNSTYTFFNINKKDFGEEKLIPINELDTILKKFEDQLSIASLINIIKSTLSYNIYDNFEATLLATDILIKRKDIAGQNAVIECFKKACEHYDPGHRYWGKTVQDALLEIIFFEFEGEPLANLLLWCDSDYLLNDYGLDGMDVLFEPAFEKIKDPELEEKLLNHFIAYIKDCDDNYVNESKILEGYENVSSRVKADILHLKKQKINTTEFLNENNELFFELKQLAEKYSKLKSTITINDLNNLQSNYLNILFKISNSKSWLLVGEINELPENLMPLTYIYQKKERLDFLEDKLAQLAIEYRGALSVEESNLVVSNYHELLKEMIYIGFHNFLDPESELPDEQMPKIYQDLKKR